MSGRTLQFDIRRAARPLIIGSAVLLLLNLVFYLALHRPVKSEHDVLSNDNAPQLTALRKWQEAVEGKESYLATLLSTGETLGQFKKEVLSSRERRMIEVQFELDRLASQFNININQVNYQNEDLPKEGLERFGMVVPLAGGYQNLRRFIRAVEESDKFLVIERVALAKGKDGGVLLQLNITLATYFEMSEEQREQQRRSAAGRTRG